MRDKIHILISIVATLIMTIVCLIQKPTLMEAVSRLILTIVLFYIIGLIAENYIKHKIFPEAPTDKPTELSDNQLNSDNVQDEELSDTSLDDYDYADETIHEDDYE